MYKDKRFSIVPEETIVTDIDYAARHFPYARRLFLCDGDALVLPFAQLQPILERIRVKLPHITRVGVYANAKSLREKTVEVHI